MSCIVRVELPKGSKYGVSYEIITEIDFSEFIENVNETGCIPKTDDVSGELDFIPIHEVKKYYQVTEH